MRLLDSSWRGCQELADSVGCSSRTVVRDISALEDLGYPIEVKGWRYRRFADGNNPANRLPEAVRERAERRRDPRPPREPKQAPRPSADHPWRRGADAYADGRDCRDDGCELARSCLSCPLPQCKYDSPNPQRQLRDEQIAAALRGKVTPISKIAERHGVSRRTVFRVAAEMAGKAPARP